MKSSRIAVLMAALPLVAWAQDPVKVDAGHYKVAVDNPTVRVLKIHVAAGEKSPMHAHPDSILVPLSTGKARFTLPDGKTQDGELVKDTATFTPAGVHAPANVGATAVDAILVEFKKPAGTATLPASRPGIQSTVLAETPYASALRATSGPDFREAAGSTHDYDQVVIALGAADLSLSVEGKPAVTKWQRGDVQFIGRGVKHEAKGVGAKPVEFIIVAIK